MSKDYLKFYIDDWLLPYETSNRCFMVSWVKRAIEVETYVPLNSDEVLRRLLKPNSTVAIKTEDGLEVVSFKAQNIKIMESTSTLNEPIHVKICYWE